VAEALALRGVSAGYGDTHVLENIDLVLATDESVSVIGRNGAGKSTLLASVMGHARILAGEIFMAGRRIDRAAVHARALAGLGFVPQERQIFPSLSVRENLEIGLRPGYWTTERVCRLFPLLEERFAYSGAQLSGGEQQMLAIGRALVTNPAVLLMDEPTEGLAPVIVQTLAKQLEEVRASGNVSIVLVEQNSHFALRFSARALVMDRGRIVYDGPSLRLREDPGYLARLIAVDAAS
jgi:branched-chain amino acid transport system ATP-binding protein